MIDKKGILQWENEITVFVLIFFHYLFHLNYFGIFVDEYGLSPDIVDGGEIWLTLDWIIITAIALCCIWN